MTQPLTGTGNVFAERAQNVGMRRKSYTYDRWAESTGIPIHTGYYMEDLRTLELGWWAERKCDAALVRLVGLEGIGEVRVTEIAPGATLPPLMLGVDEVVYVLSGRGLTSVWKDGAEPRPSPYDRLRERPAARSFEWQAHSLFLIPRNSWHTYSNTQGDHSVRLMHYNYLPIAMSAAPVPELFFNNPVRTADDGALPADVYAEAKVVDVGGKLVDNPYYWYGNFFPDMQAWDKLAELRFRGAGGSSVQIQFPASEMSCHMSVFPPARYKKGHRHGPGRAIVIPAGEGYSMLWEEGEEKVVVPWHEGSLFTPPNRWFHQHFNVGATPARYLALHPLAQFSGHSERVEDRARDQIEYPGEDPSVRERFEGELAKRGLKSAMPEQAYRDPDYQWDFKG